MPVSIKPQSFYCLICWYFSATSILLFFTFKLWSLWSPFVCTRNSFIKYAKCHHVTWTGRLTHTRTSNKNYINFTTLKYQNFTFSISLSSVAKISFVTASFCLWRVGCFFAIKASVLALCLLPLRWEFKVISLDVVTKHKAQVHSFCISFCVEVELWGTSPPALSFSAVPLVVADDALWLGPTLGMTGISYNIQMLTHRLSTSCKTAQYNWKNIYFLNIFNINLWLLLRHTREKIIQFEDLYFREGWYH